MKTTTPPEEGSGPKMEAQAKDSGESIIYQTEVPEQSESVLDKITLLFRRKPSSPSTTATKPAKPESKPARSPSLRAGKVKTRSTNEGKNPNPDMRLRAFMSPAMENLPDKTQKNLRLRPTRENTRRAYWDVAAALSLIVNAILVGVLVVMAGQLRNLKTTMNGLLGGLYSNFVDMDNASISTTIPVEAQIPVVFSLPIRQNTNVTLTDAVAVSGTQVTINTGGLSINAPARVTLPQGTNLPIALNMDVPVQVTIPISLQIPVNIPMNQTMLHAPFTGLQKTIRPLYCTIDKNAQYPQGVYICAEQKSSSQPTP